MATRKKTKTIKLGKTKIKIKNPGSFGAYCRKQGYKSGCDPRCISKGLKSKNKTIKSRARLAKGLCKLQKKKKK